MAPTQWNSKSPRVTECSRPREQSVQMAAGIWTTQERDLMEKKRIHRPHSTVEMMDELKNMIKGGNPSKAISISENKSSIKKRNIINKSSAVNNIYRDIM